MLHALSDAQKGEKVNLPGDYCECPKSTTIEHDMTLSPPMGLGFT
jgi:hypothetical protein